MTITSSLRFLYIFGGSGLLCAGLLITLADLGTFLYQTHLESVFESTLMPKKDLSSSCFLRRPQKLMKSSPSFQIDGEDFVNFCGLHRKHELTSY